jgi:uncharacterized protein YdhG (YjbR/CyaY superfamily)
MARQRFATVDDYLATQPDAVRAALERVRAAIRRTLPRAEEGIGYQIPVFRLRGRAVIYMAGWKAHYSLYPATSSVKDTLAAELAPYEVSKGTVRFPLGQPVPVRLVARIARLRAQEEAGRPGPAGVLPRTRTAISRRSAVPRG